MISKNQDIKNREDKEIAFYVQQGKDQLFSILIDRYQTKLLRYGKKFLNSNEDIEDIVQKVFIKVYKNIKSYNHNKKFSSWIYRVAHNEFVNKIKKKSKSPLRFFDPDMIFPHLLKSDENPNKKRIKKELSSTLDKHLKKLKPKYREVVILYYFEGLSYKEIAHILKIPIATVGTRLSRAKKILKDKFPKMKNFYEKE